MTPNIGRDEQELGVNAMALLEEHYGEKIIRPRPVRKYYPNYRIFSIIKSRFFIKSLVSISNKSPLFDKVEKVKNVNF